MALVGGMTQWHEPSMVMHDPMAQPEGRFVHPAMLQYTGGRLSAAQAQAQQAQPIATSRPGVSQQLWLGVSISTVWHDSCPCAALPCFASIQPVWAAPGCRLFLPASRFAAQHWLPATDLSGMHMKHAYSCSARHIGYVHLKLQKESMACVMHFTRACQLLLVLQS